MADGLKRAVLIVSTTASFITPFMGSSINLALPEIGGEFGMDAVALGWVAASYLLAAAVFLVPFGRLADIVGRRRVFFSGSVIFTVSSALIPLAHDTTFFLAYRVLQGFGSSMIFGTNIAMLTSVYPANQRGRVLGINVAAVYVGLSVGPFAGGYLTHALGWRSIFYVNAALGALVLLLVALNIRTEWADSKGERFDIPGSLLYAFALVLVMYGFSELPSSEGYWLLAGGLAILTAFLYWESRVQQPVIPMYLFRNNLAFGFSNLAALINYSATFAVTFLLSLYLRYILGFAPVDAGLVLIAQPAMMALFSPLAGRLSDRMEPHKVASFGMLVIVVGLVMFVFLHAHSSLWFIIASLLLLGIGFALFSSPNTNAVMSSVIPKQYGVASAMLGTMRLMGQMLSMGIVMMIFAMKIGKEKITPEYYPRLMSGVRNAFIVFAILSVAGIFASLARNRNGVNSQSDNPPSAVH
jgi:EmrB/QacA subfamily drug resistance transporter